MDKTTQSVDSGHVVKRKTNIAEGVTKKFVETLNSVRREKIKSFERRRKITGLVREVLYRAGKFVRTENDEAYYFFEPRHKLYEIHKDCEQFAILLYEFAELNKADPDWQYIFNELRNHALAYGDESSVWKFCRHENGKLYISRFDGKMYVLDGKEILTTDNGTDGVLFVDRCDWEPWETETLDGSFTLESLIGLINFDVSDSNPNALTLDEYRRLFLTCVMSLFFIELLPTKPLILLLGEKGSGKTSIVRQVGKLIFGERFEVTIIERSREDAFTVAVAHDFLIALDNVDTSIPWLNDRLATISTGAQMILRELYTTANERRILPRCFVWLSSRTPKFRRDDVTDRLLIFKVKRIGKGLKIPERKLLWQISKNRRSLLGELLEKVNRVVAYLNEHDLAGETSDFRLADFAVLGKAIWTVLNGEQAAEAWNRVLYKMQAEQGEFMLEGDTLPEVILAWMGNETRKGPIKPGQLFYELLATATKEKIGFNYSSTQAIGQRLSNIKSTLEEQFDIRIIESKGHANVTLRTFTKVQSEA